MITEDYVSFEVAKLLKEKGFNELTCGYYHNDYIETLLVSSPSNHNGSINAISAPSLGHAMKWLRKVYRIDITVDPHDVCGDWIYQFHLCKDKKYLFSRDISLSYEDCAEAAIKYCLINLI